MSVVAHPGFKGEVEVRWLRILYQLLTSLSRAGNLETVYEVAIASLVEATAADRAAILLLDEDGVIRFKASRGLSEAYRAAVTGHSPWPQGSCQARPWVIPDVVREEALGQYHDILRRENIRGIVFVPLELDGGVFGE